jgi:hypothetical protein
MCGLFLRRGYQQSRFKDFLSGRFRSDTEPQACYRLAKIHFREGAFAQAKLRLEEVICSFGTAREAEVPRSDVYEALSKTCKFLGEADNADHYSKLADIAEQSARKRDSV